MAQAAQRVETMRNGAPETHKAERARRTVLARSAVEVLEAAIVEERRRGRGVTVNPSGRFETARNVEIDDGWGGLDAPAPLRTHVTLEKPRAIITRNDSPDISFDRSINPYRGCEHGCVYCFARPTHAYMGLSPGLDFEAKLFAKAGAAELLERELSSPSYQCKTIAIGTNTDPYQPIEKQHRIMRAILEALARANHPVGIVTKSHLVTRDIDILAPMARKGLVKVALSITTLDRGRARSMEPRASTPERRLDAIRELSEAGVPTSVMVAPVIPGLNDSEIETILTRAHAMGAREAGYILLRLPHELRDMFSEWLLSRHPDKLRKVLSLIRSTRGGELSDATWGKRMVGEGPYAWMIGRRFETAAAKIGFGKAKTRLRTDLFSPPRKGAEQLRLF